MRVRRVSIPGTSYKVGEFFIYDRGWKSMGPVMSPSRLFHREDTCMDETHAGPPYRSGGNLRICHYNADCGVVSSGDRFDKPGGVQYRYTGGFYPQASISTFEASLTESVLHDEAMDPGSMKPGYTNAESYGAAGWRKFRPGNPTAELGVFLGELRDVPRMLKGTANFFRNLWKSLGGSPTGFGPRAVADYWLNTQFGWRPFLNDLRKFYRTTRTLDQRLQRIRRDNGRWVRRGGTIWTDVADDITASSATATKHLPALFSSFYANPSSPGSYTFTRQTVQRAWFEASFRYYIPDINSVQWERRAIAEMFGLMPNPSLLWELLPWSWLVDWGSNTGDIIANLTTGYADNLAAKYAYVMRGHSIFATVNSNLRLHNETLSDSWSFPVEWKTRVGANPFGFGLSDDMLSVRQWSILAALGISRLH